MLSKQPAFYDYYAETRTTRPIEDARLAMQAAIGLEAEWPVLQCLGLEGKSIHCLGAGPCFYEHELFRRIRPRSALASDIDRETIAALQSSLSEPSISYRVLDATHPLPPGYDVSAERFLLVQLSDTAARAVVARMTDALPSLGRAILTEYVNSYCVTSPTCNALIELRRLMMGRFKAHGADPDIGLHLEQLLLDAGMRDVAGYDITYRIEGARFQQDIVVSGRNFGAPSEILGNSYAKRFGSEYPELVRELQEWLKAAQQPGAMYSLEQRYRIATGVKP